MVRESQNDPIVFVIDDSVDVRDGLKALLESVSINCETFASVDDFLKRERINSPGCLILDVRLPGTGGLEFQAELSKKHINLPIVFITGHGDVPMSVRAMKSGAVEFLTKPLREQDVLDAVRVSLERDHAQRQRDNELSQLQTRYEALGAREREVFRCVVAGLLNKQTAARLNLSENTVKVHRRNLMIKLGAQSVPELVRMADTLKTARGSQEIC
jgi:FixJ family two-component response regulator